MYNYSELTQTHAWTTPTLKDTFNPTKAVVNIHPVAFAEQQETYSSPEKRLADEMSY